MTGHSKLGDAEPARAPGRPSDGFEAHFGAAAGGQEIQELVAQVMALARGGDKPSARTIGRFERPTPIGAGGMGVVLLAFDPVLERDVAVKMVRTERGSEREEQVRLLREAKALGKLNHPNVVSVHDAGVHERQVYLVMEFVAGLNLAEWVAQEKPGWRAVIEKYLAAGQGLAAVHKAGLVHGDFKPQNVRVRPDGRAVLVDFGLSRSPSVRLSRSPSHGLAPGEEHPSSPWEHVRSTRAAAGGTRGYIPPEQLTAGEHDARGDQFSFCVAVFHSLFGREPFVTVTTSPRAPREAARPPSPPSLLAVRGEFRHPKRGETKVPTHIINALERGLSAEPEERFDSMDELLGALTPRTSALRGPLGIAALAITMAGLGAAGVITDDPCDGVEDALVGVWDDERRAAVRGSLASLAGDDDGAVARYVDRYLTSYAARWADAARASCEDANVRSTQTLRQANVRGACLDRARGALDQTVRALRGRDEDSALRERVPEGLLGLPAIDDCSNLAFLAGSCHEPVDDEALAQTADALRDELDAVRAMLVTGNYRDAEERARALVDDVDVTAARALQAEAQFVLGDALYARGKAKESRDVLMGALEIAETGHCDGVAAGIYSRLIKLAALHGTDGPEVALERARVYRIRVRVAGEDPRHIAEHLNNEGLVLLHLARNFDGARARFEQALEQRQALVDASESPDIALVMALADSELNLANALAYQGESDASVQLLQRAMKRRTALVGEGHPLVRKELVMLGVRFMRQGKLDAARRYLEQALDLAERTVGERSDVTVNIHISLAACATYSGALDDALAHANAALAINEVLLGPDDVRHVAALEAVATVQTDRGELEAALPLLERASTLQERAGSDARSRGITAFKIAELLNRSGRHAEAVPKARVAVALLSEDGGDSAKVDAELAFAHGILADALVGPYWGENDELRPMEPSESDDAWASYSRALAIWESSGENEVQVFHARWGLAQVACARGDVARGRALASRAATYFLQPSRPEFEKELGAWIKTWLSAHCS